MTVAEFKSRFSEVIQAVKSGFWSVTFLFRKFH